jgi:hypothetical protein
MSGALDCKHARLAIGGEPHVLSAEVAQHVADCVACSKFLDETLAMEGRLKAALELPLHRFRKLPEPARVAPRRFALAASVVLALFVGAGAWLFRPQPALAAELIEHVRHEPASWQSREPVSPEVLAAVLAKAGVRYNAHLPVTYASPCPFRGHIVPHLVVQTDRGPLTVMVLAHVKTDMDTRVSFKEGEYHGIVLPAGAGSIAVLAPKGQEFDGALEDLLLDFS